MYDELAKRLRDKAGAFDYDGRPDIACDYEQAADAIEALSKLALDEHNRAAKLAWESRWIPVSERLPEKTSHYLVHIECKCDGELWSKWTDVAWFYRKFYWEYRYGAEFFKETVTHWMPLPQPPKEELEYEQRKNG